MEGVGGRERDQVNGADLGGSGEDDGSGGEGEGDDDDGDSLEPNWRMLNYWAMRLRPLSQGQDGRGRLGGHAGVRGSGNGARERPGAARRDRRQCNRFGHERGKSFAGSSAMFSMRPGSGKPRLLNVMGEREEGVCVWTARIGSHTVLSRPSS